MYITEQMIKEKYPNCKIVVLNSPVSIMNDKPIFAKIEQFNSMDEFFSKYSDVLNGTGILIMLQNDCCIYESNKSVNDWRSILYEIRLFN